MTTPNIRSIFDEASGIESEAARRVFLDEACGGAPEIRAQVEALLAAHAAAGSFLESPPAAVVGVGATLDSPVIGRSGTQIGPYKLLQQIGEGGMGVVYMAEQEQPVRRRVALKIIKPGMDTRQVIARFEAEWQALAVMDHPHIAKVFDAGTTDSGRPYFVMELVKGVPITQYCDEHYLTPRQRLELLSPVCQAIQHAHQKGIVHRDIKPTNILVAEYDEQPVPKVIDFGVAKAISQPLTEKTMFTGFGQIVGTLEYMSPEQAKLNQLDIDTRSDIYSLGVLLYELLTGSTPFDKKRLHSAAFDEMLRIIREEEPPKPSTKLSSSETSPSVAANRSMELSRLSRTVRGELDWIVMKALEKDRNRRYETANDFAQDLQRYLANEPVQACPPSAGYRLRKFVRRNRGPVLGAILVLLALVAGIIGTTCGMIRAEHARDEARTRLAQVEKVTGILASVFRDLDPIAAERAGMTSRDLMCQRLVQAAQQLEGEAVGTPLVVARLQHLLGVSLRELAHHEQAEGVLAKACRTRERLLGADHLDTAAAKHDLAIVYRHQRKCALAERLFHEVLALRTARLGADDLDTLATKHHLTELYRFQEKYALAEALCKEVLASRTARLGADDLDTLATKHQLAVLYRCQDKYALAEPLYREVLAARTERLGPDHPDNLRTKHHLALIYGSQGRFALAEQLYRDIVSANISRLGADHPATLTEHVDTLNSQYDLAGIYWAMNRLDQAIPLMEDTLKRSKAIEHPSVLGMQADLGAMYGEAGRFADAAALLEEVTQKGRQELHLAWVGNALLRAYVGSGQTAEAVALAKEQVQAARKEFQADSLELAAALAPPAQALREVEAFADAEPLYEEVLAIRIARLGADHDETILPRDGLAHICRSLKKPDQSIPLLQASLELKKAQLDPDHGEILARQVALGANYCDAGRFADGLALIEEVRRKGRDDPHPAWVRSVLLTAYAQAGKRAEATALVADRVQEARQRFAAGCPELAAVLADNGKVLADAKAYAEAERLLLEAHQVLKQDEGKTGLLANVVEWLFELYDAWGKPEVAAKWRKELEAARAAERPEQTPRP